MKKLFIIALAGLICVAFTAPAMAKLEFSGLFQLDVYYNDVSGEAARGGFNKTGGGIQGRGDVTTTEIDLAGTGNRLYWKYTSDDKKLTSFWQYRPVINQLELAWVQWELSPMFKLRFGSTEQTFAIVAPSVLTARDGASPIVGLGYCNVHGGTAREGVKAYIYPTENVRIELEAIRPDNDRAEVGLFPNRENGGINGETVSEENVMPRWDLAVNFKIANFELEPSVTWLEQEYDQVRAGDDDSITIWGVALGVKAGFGPFKFSGEIVYGQNFGNGNYVGGTAAVSGFGGAVGYARTDANATRGIEDTDILTWFIQGEYKFGPASLVLIYGQMKVENDGNPAVANDAGEFEQKTQLFTIGLPISVAKGWTIRPEITFLDNDDNARVAGNNIDYGDALSVGVGFILSF